MFRLSVCLLLLPALGMAQSFVVVEPGEGARLPVSDSLAVRGTAAPGTLVESRGVVDTADLSGNWSLVLKAPAKPGQYSLQVVASSPEGREERSVSFVQEDLPVRPDDESLRIVVFPSEASAFGEPQAEFWRSEFEKQLERQILQGAEFLDPGSLRSELMHVGGKECSHLDCALQIGKESGADLVVISRILHRGNGWRVQASAIPVLVGGSIANPIREIGPNLSEMPVLWKSLADTLGWVISRAWDEPGHRIRTQNQLQTGTPLVGILRQDTLRASQSPYVVQGTVTVPAGQILYVEPGVTIYFEPGRYAGLQVFGQMLAKGTEDKPIRFLSAAKDPGPWDWNRILFVSRSRSQMSHCEIANSNYGIHVENSALTLDHVLLRGNAIRGIFVRNSELLVKDSRIVEGHAVGLQAGAYASVNLERTVLDGNRNAIAVTDLGRVELNSSRISSNDRAVLLVDSASLLTRQTSVTGNLVAVAANHPVDVSTFRGIKDNSLNFSLLAPFQYDDALEEPDVPYLSRQADTGPRFPTELGEVDRQETWSTVGSLQFGGGYRVVKRRYNPGPADSLIGGDTVRVLEKYPNTFAVDGPLGNASVFLSAQSTQGRTLELSADLSANRWTPFYANPVQLRYATPRYQLRLGDMQETEGELFLSGLPLLGADLQLGLLGSGDGAHPLRMVGFFGESRRSLAVGTKNPDLFGDRVSEGDAVSQQLVGGGFVQLSGVGGFRLLVGGMASGDRAGDPLLRDGIEGQETRDPLQQARSAFLRTGWTSRDRRLDMDFQIAFGRSDTADADWQKGIDRSFASMGFDAPSASEVRSLFASDASIDAADSATLYAFVPDTLSQDSARSLLKQIRQASLVARDSIVDAREASRDLGMNWGWRDVAMRLEGLLRFQRSSLGWHAQYVGDRYASPGVPGLAQDGREYGLEWSHSPLGMWDYTLGYTLSIEDAGAPGRKERNRFGFGEGTKWGVFPDADWHKEHLQDEGRAKFVHTVSTVHNLRLGARADLEVGYEFGLRRQQTGVILMGSSDPADGIAQDPWFQANGSSSILVAGPGSDSVSVDSARWTEWSSAILSADTLASGFLDQAYSHRMQSSVLLRLANMTLRIGGEWFWQLDRSRFREPGSSAQFALADSTWGKLGYWMGGNNQFSHSYPLVLTSRIGGLTNRTSFQPRWSYTDAYEQSTRSWNLGDRLEIPLYRRVFLLTVEGALGRSVYEETVASTSLVDSAGIHYSWYHITPGGVIVGDLQPAFNSERVDESTPPGDYMLVVAGGPFRDREIRMELQGTLRWNFTTSFYAEFAAKIAKVDRPQMLSQEWQDREVSVNTFYSF